MILFLDFDGVLHPIPTDARGHFCHLPRLEEFLRKHEQVQVVVSSSWREAYPWEVIVEIFAADVQSRIIDMTPIFQISNRYDEIQGWRVANRYDGPWLALDDAVNEFPLPCGHLIECETAVGLDDAVLARLTVAAEADHFVSIEDAEESFQEVCDRGRLL